MFTDIVGYTTLMGNDEQQAFDLLHKNRQLQQALIKEFNGTWVKEIGDGVLASFISAADAVMCAGAIQQTSTQIPGLQLRIGIHLGDIVFENNDIFGDGVNIASRIQAIAAIGSIWVSEIVHNLVANKKQIHSTFIRKETLKNVSEPIAIYELTVDTSTMLGLAVELNNGKAIQITKSPHEKSIAVMPFVNMSNDPNQEYFSDGMAEEIINSLSHVKDMNVAGRTSSFQFKGKNIDLREVGKKLNVQTVLEGSVRRQGSRVRITAQLINVVNGYHIWSERYDKELDDIFAIQDEIAIAITEKLKITLLNEERLLIEKKPTEDHEAYDLYLKGRFYLNKRGSGIGKALQYFHQAVAKDPEFSLAFAGMADVHCLLALYSIVPPHQGMPKAKQYAEKAIKSNNALAEAYTSLAFISIFYDWDWNEAKRIFQLVFAINPSYAPAHYWYSYYLSFVECKFEEAVQEATKAERLEPMEPVPFHIASMMYINYGKFEEALQASQTAIQLDPMFFPAYRSLGMSLVGLKRLKDAIEALQTAVSLSTRQPLPMVELCWVYSLAGMLDQAQEIMDEFIARSSTEFISPMFLCCVAYFSNHQDEAAKYIEDAYEQRESTFPCIKVYPLFTFVRKDPSFQPFLRRMNFPEPI